MTEEIVTLNTPLNKGIVELLEFEAAALGKTSEELLSLILRRRYINHYYI